MSAEAETRDTSNQCSTPSPPSILPLPPLHTHSTPALPEGVAHTQYAHDRHTRLLNRPDEIEAELASYPGPGRYHTERHRGDEFRVAKRQGGADGHDAYGVREPWTAPPSVGAGVSTGAAAAAGGGGGAGRGDAGGGDVTVLPKRHARFMERFQAAKEARGAVQGGVTSFGPLGAGVSDTVGRAD